MKWLYYVLLGLATGWWFWEFQHGNAPQYTTWFWIYPALLYATEIYLIELKTRYPKPYPLVKLSQRLVEVVIIFLLVNGDLGKVILIELFVITAESLWRSKTRPGPEASTVYDTTWLRINRFDFEVGKFLLVSLAVLGYTYGLPIIGEIRFLLLAGLMYRKVMSVRRESLGWKPGCDMDKRQAIVLAAWMLAVGLLGAVLPDGIPPAPLK